MIFIVLKIIPDFFSGFVDEYRVLENTFNTTLDLRAQCFPYMEGLECSPSI